MEAHMLGHLFTIFISVRRLILLREPWFYSKGKDWDGGIICQLLLLNTLSIHAALFSTKKDSKFSVFYKSIHVQIWMNVVFFALLKSFFRLTLVRA